MRRLFALLLLPALVIDPSWSAAVTPRPLVGPSIFRDLLRTQDQALTGRLIAAAFQPNTLKSSKRIEVIRKAVAAGLAVEGTILVIGSWLPSADRTSFFVYAPPLLINIVALGCVGWWLFRFPSLRRRTMGHIEAARDEKLIPFLSKVATLSTDRIVSLAADVGNEVHVYNPMRAALTEIPTFAALTFFPIEVCRRMIIPLTPSSGADLGLALQLAVFYTLLVLLPLLPSQSEMTGITYGRPPSNPGIVLLNWLFGGIYIHYRKSRSANDIARTVLHEVVHLLVARGILRSDVIASAVQVLDPLSVIESPSDQGPALPQRWSRDWTKFYGPLDLTNILYGYAAAIALLQSPSDETGWQAVELAQSALAKDKRDGAENYSLSLRLGGIAAALMRYYPPDPADVSGGIPWAFLRYLADGDSAIEALRRLDLPSENSSKNPSSGVRVATAKFAGSADHLPGEIDPRIRHWEARDMLEPVPRKWISQWSAVLKANLLHTGARGSFDEKAQRDFERVIQWLEKGEAVGYQMPFQIVRVGGPEIKYLLPANRTMKTMPQRVLSRRLDDDLLTIYVPRGALGDADIPYGIAHDLKEQYFKQPHWLTTLEEYAAFKRKDYLGLHLPPRLGWEIEYAREEGYTWYLEALRQDYVQGPKLKGIRTDEQRELAQKTSNMIKEAAGLALAWKTPPAKPVKEMNAREWIHHELILLTSDPEAVPAGRGEQPLLKLLLQRVETPELMAKQLGQQVGEIGEAEAALLVNLKRVNNIPAKMTVLEWLSLPPENEEVRAELERISKLPPVITDFSALKQHSDLDQLLAFLDKAGDYFDGKGIVNGKVADLSVLKLIAALREDGRLTDSELALRMGRSINTIPELKKNALKWVKEYFSVTFDFVTFRPYLEPGDDVARLPFPSVAKYALRGAHIVVLKDLLNHSIADLERKKFSAVLIKDIQATLAWCDLELKVPKDDLNQGPAGMAGAIGIAVGALSQSSMGTVPRPLAAVVFLASIALAIAIRLSSNRRQALLLRSA